MMAFMTPILQTIILLSSILAAAPYLTLRFPTCPPFEKRAVSSFLLLLPAFYRLRNKETTLSDLFKVR